MAGNEDTDIREMNVVRVAFPKSGRGSASGYGISSLIGALWWGLLKKGLKTIST
jgi:hypothetical protein